MGPEKDQAPNFNQLQAMGSIDKLIELASDSNLKSEYRESAIDHLPFFFGLGHDQALKDLFINLSREEGLPEAVADALENARVVLAAVEGHTDDVDYLIDLVKKSDLSSAGRATIFMVLERHENGARADDIKRAEVVRDFRESFEEKINLDVLGRFPRDG